jgi:hypothetical protein
MPAGRKLKGFPNNGGGGGSSAAAGSASGGNGGGDGGNGGHDNGGGNNNGGDDRGTLQQDCSAAVFSAPCLSCRCTAALHVYHRSESRHTWFQVHECWLCSVSDVCLFTPHSVHHLLQAAALLRLQLQLPAAAVAAAVKTLVAAAAAAAAVLLLLPLLQAPQMVRACSDVCQTAC